MRVLISGVARSTGRLVAEQLVSDPVVETVIGLDSRACYPPVAGLRFVRADARRPEWTAWLAGIDVAISLDAAGWPLRRALREQEAILLAHVRAFVAAVQAAGVPKLIVANSAALYGALPVEARVDENTPVRGHAASAYARPRAQLADSLDAFAPRWSGVLTRLRTGWIAGPRHPSLVNTWHAGPVLACGYEDRRLPVVHEADFVAAVRLTLDRDLAGVYHVAADDGLTLHELAALLGHDDTCRPLAWLALRAWWRWRWWGARTPPDWFRALYQGAALDAGKLGAAGWLPRYTPRETISAALGAYPVD